MNNRGQDSSGGHRIRAIGACLLSTVLSLPPAWSAEEAIRNPNSSTNAAHRAACERQLNLIHGAIQQYRRQRDGGLPHKLSDLTPDFLHDPKILICPFVQTRGGLRLWKKQFHELSPDPRTSYNYEFSPAPLLYNQWRGLPKKTWRDLKQRVTEELGPVVPIVRCHDHLPTLNLAVSGWIYESERYWERKFTTNDDLLTVSKLFASTVPSRKITAADFPPRDPLAGTRLLDLTRYYNASLTNSWQGFPRNHLAGLVAGLYELGGVRFDIRGIIQLQGNEFPVEFPKSVDGMEVNQKCSRIHFLHALGFLYKTKVTNGSYIVSYTDGQRQEISLVNGKHIADWWHDPENPLDPTDAQVAWTGENEAATAYGKSLRLYKMTWENPLKDTAVAAISFDVGARTNAPFVVAITLE
jgi:hypothetical protein